MTDREILDRNLEELQALLDRHKRFVSSALDGRPLESPGCLTSVCHHRQALVDVVLHAVKVLEETRKSFKSKQLEALRKHLVEALRREMNADGRVMNS